MGGLLVPGRRLAADDGLQRDGWPEVLRPAESWCVSVPRSQRKLLQVKILLLSTR